jgi:hypothetical protein
VEDIMRFAANLGLAALVTLVALVALRVLMVVAGGVFGLLFGLLWFGLKIVVVVGVFWFVLKIVAPDAARKLKGTFR